MKNEFRAFAGLMIFLRADWWRPWNDSVCCSDASTTGGMGFALLIENFRMFQQLVGSRSVLGLSGVADIRLESPH